ncbi:hypothetical protein AC249_AIPGENE19447 [Exaiptasia diaphana]|nr:hypothetical protein AC249_AIPGENE19447 [Exaiptasia diaphana]
MRALPLLDREKYPALHEFISQIAREGIEVIRNNLPYCFTVVYAVGSVIFAQDFSAHPIVALHELKLDLEAFKKLRIKLDFKHILKKFNTIQSIKREDKRLDALCKLKEDESFMEEFNKALRSANEFREKLKQQINEMARKQVVNDIWLLMSVFGLCGLAVATLKDAYDSSSLSDAFNNFARNTVMLIAGFNIAITARSQSSYKEAINRFCEASDTALMHENHLREAMLEIKTASASKVVLDALESRKVEALNEDLSSHRPQEGN